MRQYYLNDKKCISQYKKRRSCYMYEDIGKSYGVSLTTAWLVSHLPYTLHFLGIENSYKSDLRFSVVCD